MLTPWEDPGNPSWVQWFRNFSEKEKIRYIAALLGMLLIGGAIGAFFGAAWGYHQIVTEACKINPFTITGVP